MWSRVPRCARGYDAVLGVLLHGLPAAAGPALLLFDSFTIGISSDAVWALALPGRGAPGGPLLNFGYRENHKLLPRPVMYVPVAIAVIGLINARHSSGSTESAECGLYT